MAYKDKDKQRESQREWVRQKRVSKGSTQQGSTHTITTPQLPANFGEYNCECMHCKTNRTNGNKHTINHDVRKSSQELVDGALNRVSLPSDSDYAGKGVQVAS